MNEKKILNQTRIRRTHNRFGFVPHRFLRDGFLFSLEREEAFLYLFYILAADRYGISFYGDRRIGKGLNMTQEELNAARNGLIHKDLIRCEGAVCQVLELPSQAPGRLKHDDHVNSFSDLKKRLSR